MVHISSDAVIDKNQGPVFKVKLNMRKSNLNTGSRVVSLIPGMTVTAEIKTGKRRIMDFLVVPIETAMRER